jgi:hypothetical protein
MKKRDCSRFNKMPSFPQPEVAFSRRNIIFGKMNLLRFYQNLFSEAKR